MFILNVLKQHATRTPDALAIAFEDNEWSYRELYNNAQKLQRTYSNRAIKKGILLLNLC